MDSGRILCKRWYNYQGSLVVNYAITTDDGDKEALKQIQQN